LLGRIGACLEEDEFIEIPFKVDRPFEDREREKADALLPFRSMAKLKVDVIA
jgi:hypothetical protein